MKLDCDYLTDIKGKIVKAKRIIIHEIFQRTAHDSFLYDIALVVIDDETPPDIEYPKMMDAALEGDILSRKRYEPKVIGCGKNAFSRVAALTNYLHRTTVRVVSNELCNMPKSYSGLVNDFELCAGLDGADACQGDSGGPLVLWDDDHGYLLLGLVSWGGKLRRAEQAGRLCQVVCFSRMD